MKPEEIYQTALSKWGMDSQLDMMVEECAELINAIQKFRRNRIGSSDVVGEIADVEIMAGQMRVIFGTDIVDMEKALKLKRLIERINQTEEK